MMHGPIYIRKKNYDTAGEITGIKSEDEKPWRVFITTLEHTSFNSIFLHSECIFFLIFRQEMNMYPDNFQCHYHMPTHHY
jgi:hypothetical protein